MDLGLYYLVADCAYWGPPKIQLRQTGRVSVFNCFLLSKNTISQAEETLKKAESGGEIHFTFSYRLPHLSLPDFLLRARVLKLYRQALRTTRRAPVQARAELRHVIRQEIENNRNCSDKQKIRFLISEGLERLKGLNETLDMQGHF